MSICSVIACTLQSVGLILTSFHTEPGFKTFTPGVYAVTTNGEAAGVFVNSEGNPSAFVGKLFERNTAANTSVALLVGGVVGYYKPLPMLVPSTAFNVGSGKLRLSLNVKPPKAHRGAHALTVSYETPL